MNFNSDQFGVELHLHLDGSYRPATLFEIAEARRVKLPCCSSEELSSMVRIKTPTKLANFLEPFKWFNKILAGDKNAIARISTEFVEDCATQSNLCYVEVRFAPHLLAGPDLTPEAVVKTVLEVVQRVGHQLGVEVRVILSNIRQYPEWAAELLKLATDLKPHGVVGIDVAGDDGDWLQAPTAPAIVKTFQQAKSNNIHRTVHAGENGPAAAVNEAIFKMHAERIGHGYHVIDCPDVYAAAKKHNVHFEVCPVSSCLTSSVPTDLSRHPVKKFIADQVSYSINTDCPLITGCWGLNEARFCMEKLGLTVAQLTKANFYAAEAAFLDSNDERDALLEHLKRSVGVSSIRG